MTPKEMVSARVTASDAVLTQAVADAESAILDLCHRDCLIPALIPLQVSLATVYVHRILAAGEGSRTEGGVSVSYAYATDIPEDLMRRILAHRRLRQAGVANAVKKSKNVSP